MDKVLIAIGGVILLGAVVVLAAIMGAVFGSIGGYLVGWAFDETTAKVLEFAGLSTFEMWEVGATLGFLGGFARSSTTCNN